MLTRWAVPLALVVVGSRLMSGALQPPSAMGTTDFLPSEFIPEHFTFGIYSGDFTFASPSNFFRKIFSYTQSSFKVPFALNSQKFFTHHLLILEL